MKKILVCSFLIFFILSCSTRIGHVYDETVPIEKSAWLLLDAVGNVIRYNTVSVNWVPGINKLFQIPAGDTELEWVIKRVTGRIPVGYITSTGNAISRYVFMPGKKYYFLLQIKDGVPGLDIYAWNYEEKISYTQGALEKHYIGFEPFVYQSGLK